MRLGLTAWKGTGGILKFFQFNNRDDKQLVFRQTHQFHLPPYPRESFNFNEDKNGK